MSHRIRLATLLACLSVSFRAMAQGGTPPNAPPPERLQQAATFFAGGDWGRSLSAYEALARDFPHHALSRFRVGVSLLELNRFAEAESSLEAGERMGIPAPQAAYRLAQLRAEQGQPTAAFAQLQRAAAAQFPATPSSLAADRHLASLKSRPEWAAILDAFDAVVQPCRHDARYRQFDFWLGDWDVRAAGAPTSPPARNTVTLEDNGCVVTEHWSAPGGSEGQSFNMFDVSYGVWRQTWVDNSGGQHDYRGSLENGNMVFRAELPGPRGSTSRVTTRLTFFPLGGDTVRQFSESSPDGGKTWQVAYDLYYVRRKLDGSKPSPYGGPLTDPDRAAIRALDSSYVRGWLTNDPASVLATFSADAVLMPPGGRAVAGQAQIRAYWWPNDGSSTTIRSFTHQIEEIDGTRALAFVRGTSTLSWDVAREGTTTTQTSRSTELRLVRRDDDGRWHIVRQMWAPLP